MTCADTIQPMLRFLQAGLVGESYEVQWTGSWPPPVSFHLFLGRGTGVMKCWPTEDQLPPELEDGVRPDSIERSVFERAHYSILTDEQIAEMDHVMRGAEYRRVAE